MDIQILQMKSYKNARCWMSNYLAPKQLAELYPFGHSVLRDIISRGEFAPYRQGETLIKILYCEETKKLLEHFIAIKQKKRGNR